MRSRTAIEVGLTAALSFVVSLVALSPTLSRLGDAWADGDMLSTYVNVNNWGWLSFTSGNHYGYPLGMDLGIFPTLDITQNIFAKVVSSLSGNPYLGINLLFVLSFPLIAVLAYCSIRLTGLRGPLAIALAVSFTFVPFHFGRGLGHTYLAMFYGAVAAVILAQLMGTGRLKVLTGKKIAAVIPLVILAAWSGTYYAVFGLILMASAWLWLCAQQDSKRLNRQLLISATPIVAMVVLLAIGTILSLLTARSDPAFATLGDRTPFESVIFAGILAMAILPAPMSKLALLADYNINVTDAFSAAPALENATLGNYGTWVTFGALIVIMVALFTRVRSHLGFLSMLLVVSILFFIPWGLNYLFAATITPQIRAWNRMVPIILLLVILLVATVAVHLKINSYAVLAIAVVIVGVTAVESAWPWRATYANTVTTTSEVSQAGSDYTNAINAALPQNCAILQLPATGYPEQGPLGNFNDYDHFWLSLNDSTKSWSYGAVKNTRAGAWMAQLPEVPGSEEIELLAQAGFCGIHLDTRAFVPPAQARIVANLTERYGPPTATGGTEQLGVYPNWMFFTTDQNAQRVDPVNWDVTLTNYFNAPAITTIAQPTGELAIAPRGSKDDLMWWWTIAPTAEFGIHQLTPDQPLTRVTGGVRIPACLDTETAQIALTLSTGETIIVEANPTTTTEFELKVKDPTVNDSGNLTTMSVTTDSPGCQPADFPYEQFVQVIDLSTR
jgi:hypothetical protein